MDLPHVICFPRLATCCYWGTAYLACCLPPPGSWQEWTAAHEPARTREPPRCPATRAPELRRLAARARCTETTAGAAHAVATARAARIDAVHAHACAARAAVPVHAPLPAARSAPLAPTPHRLAPARHDAAV